MQKKIIVLLLVLAAIFGTLFHLIGLDPAHSPEEKRSAFAIARMLTGLIIIWIFIGGAVMYRFRDRVRDYVRSLPFDWRVKFVVFAVLLACLEEVVTVTMTNLAPVFGSTTQLAHITASTNYFDVIIFHSVIVFVPYFIAMAWLLSRYDFKPFSLFLAFGLVGTVSEAIFAGNFGAFVMFPVWAFVYGLMVYLPAYSIPENRQVSPVRFYHNLMLAPAIFFTALPMILPIVYVIAVVLGHPGMDFDSV